MKKISISLFAILAIVFAVSSAFTVKIAKKPLCQSYFMLQNSTSVSIGTFCTPGTTVTNGFQNLGTYVADDPIDYLAARENCGEEGDQDVVCAAELIHANCESLQQADLNEVESIVYRELQ